MDAWNQLINIALLGSGKAEGTDLLSALPGMEGAQQAIQERSGDAETRLLETMALLYTYRRAGVMPRSETTGMTVAEAEIKPYCSAQAVRTLKDILMAGSNGLLRLWLERCDAAGQVAPPDLIVSLLDEAQKHKALRPLVVSCCGKRGEWLGRVNDFTWDFLTSTAAADDAERWSTGSIDERKAALAAVRATDPAAARAMLEAVWKQEKADVKEALLQTLGTGLSPDDLPFLESIAGDKSKRVQILAYDLMTRIPTSAALRVMEAALQQAIKLQTTKKLLGLVSKTSLEITFPQDLHKQLQDALGKQAAGTISDGEQVLLTMMGYVSPGFWETHLAAPPARILELFKEAADKRFRYYDAFRHATIRHRDQAWANLFKNDDTSFEPDLLPLFSEADRQTYLGVHARSQSSADYVMEYYREEELPWEETMAPALINHIVARPYQYHKGFFNANVHLIPVGILPVLDSFAPRAPAHAKDYTQQHIVQTWQSTRAHLQTLLEMKQQLLNAFN